jgi:hypothetical protein
MGAAQVEAARRFQQEGAYAVELLLAALMAVCAVQRGFEHQWRPWQDSNLQPTD